MQKCFSFRLLQFPGMFALLLVMTTTSLLAKDSRRITWRGASYDIYTVKPDNRNLKLYWKNRSGEIYGSFRSLRSQLKKQGRKLLFATNAGIFAPGQVPLGLHIERGRVLRRINRKRGRGNFYLRPNGVFYVTRAGRARIKQTRHFRVPARKIRLATQSGPMLVFNNRIHWLFRRHSPSVYIRNAVGINNKGHIVFAISREPVNMHAFASLFRYRLKCRNALYLDGSISKMYLPALGRRQQSGNFAGILAVSR